MPSFLKPLLHAPLLASADPPLSVQVKTRGHKRLSGLANANAKSQRFSYATSQIATLPPVLALNRSSKNRKLQLDTLRFGTQFPKSHWPLSFSVPKSQRFKSQRLQDANATKSQTRSFCESQRFSATTLKTLTSLLIAGLGPSGPLFLPIAGYGAHLLSASFSSNR